MTALPINLNDDYYVCRKGQNRALASATADTLVSVLDLLGLVSPAAHDMPLDEVISQVNEVNGGEIFVERVLM